MSKPIQNGAQQRPEEAADMDLFHETFSALRAPEGSIEEVIAMTEQKKTKKWGRTALIALAACAALIGSASAANAATGGELWADLSSFIQVNVFKSVAVTPEGDTVTMIDMTADIEERDGRTILVVPGEEVDITDALLEDGAYHYKKTDGGTVCQVDVTGTPEKWTMQAAVYDEGEEPTVILVTDSEDNRMAVTPDGEALNPGEEVEFTITTFGGTEDDASQSIKRGLFTIETE